MGVTIEDYKRLSESNQTVKREYDYFKERIFNECLIYEGRRGYRCIKYDPERQMFPVFDIYKNISYEEAVQVAYTKYYRSISGFILPPELRVAYFLLAYQYGNLRAIRSVQKCLGVPVDGIIGPVTREKLQDIDYICFFRISLSVHYKVVKVMKGFKRFLIKVL